MLHENEMIMIVIGLTLLVFLVLNYRQLKQTPFFQLLFVSYCLSTTSWMMTVLEGFFFEASLNFIEHLCYASSAVLFAVWCWMIPGRTRGNT